METAAVEPGNEPMCNEHDAEQPQCNWRLLAARTHALAQKVGIKRDERRHEDRRQNGKIEPEAGIANVPAAAEQRGSGKHDEQRRLDIG